MAATIIKFTHPYFPTPLVCKFNFFNVLETEFWVQVTTMSLIEPVARVNHGYFMMDQFMVIYGGSNGEVLLSDMWTLNVYTREWTEIEQPSINPGARSSISFTTYGRYAFMFSGFNYDGFFCNSDLWRFDFDKVEWTIMAVAENSTIPSPRARYCLKMIDHYLVLYGGAPCRGEGLSNGLLLY